ncbi:DUF1449 family protein, partial [Escherichia coli]|uniref:OB-fold-containig protein n=1 Tax=Escherichia coli TaxID=562 RepID=UPI000E49518F
QGHRALSEHKTLSVSWSHYHPCEGKLTDQFGQIHYLLLEPEEGKIFTKGDKVLIICRLSATRYLAENNPWPQIL